MLRIAVVVAVATGVSLPPAEAVQRASASLAIVEGTDIAGRRAPQDECGNGACSTSRRVCLPASQFVLVLQPYRNWSVASVTDWDESEVMAEVLIVNQDEPGWGWQGLQVSTATCYDVKVTGGRLRLFQMKVGVEW